MAEILRCNQQGCGEPALYWYTWPGRDQAGICLSHSSWLRSVADAIGMPLQLIPVPVEKEESVEL